MIKISKKKNKKLPSFDLIFVNVLGNVVSHFLADPSNLKFVPES